MQSNPASIMTIERFIQNQQEQFPQASGQFTLMLQDMAMAGKLIARETIRAGITDVLGETDTENVHGERQKRLDILADRIIYQMNSNSGRVVAMASEEHADLLDVTAKKGNSRYILLYDPMDGSSNIDVNVGVGTIFSIHRQYTHSEHVTMDDVLQSGTRLVAAGYIIYGSSTMMVYTTGMGVHGFTLDPTIGEFLLSHENIQIPEKPAYYSANHGSYYEWTEGVQRAINWLQGDSDDSPNLSLRYTGTFVGDFHRNLLKGGVYLYPHSQLGGEYPNGKIRLTYEAQALGFIAEQAGGYASDGVGNVLTVEPHDLHQRTPIFIGNRNLVERIEQFIQEDDTDWLEKFKNYRRK